MSIRIVVVALLGLIAAITSVAQNSNTSTTAQPRTTNTNQKSAPTKQASPTPKSKPSATSKPSPAATTTSRAAQPKSATAATVPGSTAVMAAFNSLLDGIRHSNVNEVTSVYWNSPHLILFNNNGTVTKSWDQVRKNRESSYPDLKDVKLEVRDVSVNMLGRDGAVVSCLWTQSQNYKGTPETASGRMTLVFKRVGTAWKAIHLHSSPDKPDPSRVLPSEQTSPTPTATPTPSPSPQP
jgi:ketosteroid isomerase-like protein